MDGGTFCYAPGMMKDKSLSGGVCYCRYLEIPFLIQGPMDLVMNNSNHWNLI